MTTENRKPSSEIRSRLATNVKRLREARGFTQHQLSEHCGLSPSYIGSVEQEAVNITLANLEALARGALLCSEVDLLMPIRRAPEPI
jgi:transcriptional regulator with XRE-family HTH domain